MLCVRPGRLLFIAAIATALGVTGCGSSKSSSSNSSPPATSSASSAPAPSGPASTASSSGGGTASADAIAQAQAVVSKFAERPTSLGITDKVTSVPKGKTLFYVYNQGPAAVATAAAMQQAVTTIGWTYKSANVAPTPQGFQSGFEAALRDSSTSAIVSSSIDKSVVAAQLAQANAKKIPVVIIAGANPSSSSATVIGGPPTLNYIGVLKANYVLAQTKGDGQVLIATSLAYPAEAIETAAYKTEWARICPACKAPLVFDAPLTSYGTNFPSLLTAYLQAHRSVTYIDFGFNDEMIGVDAALKGANFGSLHSVTYVQGPETNQLYGGLLDASVGFPLLENSWLAVDTVLRIMNNQSTAPDVSFNGPSSPFNWFITKQSIAQAGLDLGKYWPLDADYEAQFKALWGLS